ncbi:MAG: Flp pilus assembly protein CpaB [Ancalomicrobiaceae bacterium]|nr:Flp pilus assembly protein CpaB [Ancalomicrobiaceae bacterium]
MKLARGLVIGIAVASGGLAALLAYRMASRPPVETLVQAPVAEPQQKQNAVEVLVTRRDIPVGTTVSKDDMVWEPWPEGSQTDAYITKSSRPTAIEELAGSVARTAFLNGEPVREARLMKAERGFMSVILTPGMRAIAIEVRAVGTAGGFILPSDHVDVILTRAAPKTATGQSQGDPFVTETLLTNIKVLAIDQQISENKGEAAVVAKNTATLEVSPKQSEMIAQAQQLGTLSLVLRPLRDAAIPEAVADTQDQGGPVTVVRYGVSTRVTPH